MNEMIEGHAYHITDDDIRWVTGLLDLPDGAFYGSDGSDARQDVLKSSKTIDVAACPGSGKTTLLVAKLALLARRWTHRTMGICVLSHTNAAREVIEKRLGSGHRLLAYPHYVGTIHGFINTFLALPWLRSKGYPLKIIHTQTCLWRRWYNLPYATREALGKNGHDRKALVIQTPEFEVKDLTWGKKRKGKGRACISRDRDTYKRIRQSCELSAEDGYFCFDEMFMWAHNLLDRAPGVIEIIRSRFPFLFIDEAQDNSEVQAAILHRVFIGGDTEVVRHRFGDENQAIFDSISEKDATTDRFPDRYAKKAIANSFRFGQAIANLADPLGIEQYRMRGLGPRKPLRSGEEGLHTILVFEQANIATVLDEYGKLLLETFSARELQEGTFAAVGQVHRVKALEDQGEKEGADNTAWRVGDYWVDYDFEISSADPKPETLVQYILAGLSRAKTIGETYPAVEKIAEGVMRLAGMVEGGVVLRPRRRCHRCVLSLLEGKPLLRGSYLDVVMQLAVRRCAPSKKRWFNHYRAKFKRIAKGLSGASLTSEADRFLEWAESSSVPTRGSGASASHGNLYRYPQDHPKVYIRVGSVHSVKGQTHTATLVLETHWYAHNLENIMPWIEQAREGFAESKGIQQKTRLKLHYVAMTRPTHLLCLAVKRSTVENDDGTLNQDRLERLRLAGWHVRFCGAAL